jgi:hypothetical protein
MKELSKTKINMAPVLKLSPEIVYPEKIIRGFSSVFPGRYSFITFN